MLTVLAFTFGQALDRHFLKTTFSAHDQIAKIALIWLVFSGTALAYQRRENLRIDLIGKYLSAGATRWRSLAFESTIGLLALLLHVKAWSVIQVAAFQQILGTPFTNVLPYSAILAGTATIVLSCFVRMADDQYEPGDQHEAGGASGKSGNGQSRSDGRSRESRR